MRRNGNWDDIVLHAQIEEEIAFVGAPSIKNQHGGARIVPSLPPLLELGMKICATFRGEIRTVQQFAGKTSIFLELRDQFEDDRGTKSRWSGLLDTGRSKFICHCDPALDAEGDKRPF
jgi:hypothetical protein